VGEFEQAIPVILTHEGRRYTNDPADPGGPTKYGITLKYAAQVNARGVGLDMDDDGDVDEVDILLLDESSARAAYRWWWDREGYGRIVDHQIATKVFDLAVNVGPRRAHRFLQRALNRCGYALAEDGILGPATIAATNDAESRELLLEVCHEQTEHYRRWCDAKPERERFREGLHTRGAWPFVAGGYA
jgi:lysozyme family protein